MSYELKPLPSNNERASLGARVRIRSAIWKIQRVEPDGAANFLHCEGLTGIVKGKTAVFIDRLEPDLTLLDSAYQLAWNDPGNRQAMISHSLERTPRIPAVELT